MMYLVHLVFHAMVLQSKWRGGGETGHVQAVRVFLQMLLNVSHSPPSGWFWKLRRLRLAEILQECSRKMYLNKSVRLMRSVSLHLEVVCSVVKTLQQKLKQWSLCWQ